MQRRKELYIVQHNITDDPFSRLMREFTFEPHAFGHQHDQADAVCDFRVVGDFELIFVKGGQSLITVGQQECQLQQNEIFLIPPFTRHKIDTPPLNPHDNYWIHFDVFPLHRQKEFEIIIARSIRHISASFFQETLLPLLRQMEESRNICGARHCFETLFSLLMFHLIRNQYDGRMENETQMGQTIAETDMVNRGMQFIQHHLETPLKIQDLCEYLHVSESYLHKTFTKVMHLSPNYLILLCKVKKAEQMMKTTPNTIKEIAERLCFSSQYYFSTVFKRFYGVSPRAFLEMNDFFRQ